MHRLLLSEGGHPLTLDDIYFLQLALSTPIMAGLNAWGNCIVSGCEISVDATGKRTISSGIIAFAGDIYQVYKHDLAPLGQGEELYWEFWGYGVGKKTYADGQGRHTQFINTAALRKWGAAPTGKTFARADTLPRLGVDILRATRRTFSYDGKGDVVDFQEQSAHSALVTFRFDDQTYPLNSTLGTLTIDGASHLHASHGLNGSWLTISSGNLQFTADITGSTRTPRSSDPREAGGQGEVRATLPKYVTLLVSYGPAETTSSEPNDPDRRGTGPVGGGYSGPARRR